MDSVAPFTTRGPSVGLTKTVRHYTPADPWRHPNGGLVNWQASVIVNQTSCNGPRAHEPATCADVCCVPPVGGTIVFDCPKEPQIFKPFKVAKALCLPDSCMDSVYLDGLDNDMNLLMPVALETVLHAGIATNPSLQSQAVNLSPGGGTSIGEGIGSLLAYRAGLRTSGGWLHVPAYAACQVGPVLSGMVAGFGASPFNATNLGFGYPTAGPLGVAAPAGHAWLYVSGAAITAEGVPSVRQDLNQYLDRKTGCWLPVVDRLAIVVWDTCGTAAVLVDLREKGC